MTEPATALPQLAPGDAAWLLVLVEQAVPAAPPGHPMDWEGQGRQHAYDLLTAAAGAVHAPCSGTCNLGQGHGGDHLPR